MAQIRPFRGLRYDPSKIALKEVITEPYDRITPEMQENYYNRSPHNVVRIILGKDSGFNKYTRAQYYILQWQEEGILIRETRPSFYIYRQDFKAGTREISRTGILARVGLEDRGKGKIMPHEKTFPEPKKDRHNLIKATNTHTEQIFALYQNEEKNIMPILEDAISQAAPVADVTDEEGFRHRLWAVSEPELIRKIQDAFEGRELIIADGHHRHEASRIYMREMAEKSGSTTGEEPFNYTSMVLFDIDDPGLVILPTFRLVRGLDNLKRDGLDRLLSTNFRMKRIPWTRPQDFAVVEEIQREIEAGSHQFAVCLAEWEEIIHLTLKDDARGSGGSTAASPISALENLDVNILHHLIIDKLKSFTRAAFSSENNIYYERNLFHAVYKVKTGEYQLLFLLPPASISQVAQIAKRGEVMPHKSTDFFPKLKSGLVMDVLDE